MAQVHGRGEAGSLNVSDESLVERCGLEQSGQASWRRQWEGQVPTESHTLLFDLSTSAQQPTSKLLSRVTGEDTQAGKVVCSPW